jgi:hypothetical protein
VDGTADRDPDKTTRTAINGGNTGNNVGSVQQDAYKAHTHSITGGQSSGPGQSGAGSTFAQATAGDTGSSGGAETRPVNLYVYYIIKT